MAKKRSFKRFLTRMNRGIALGVVLAILLVGFVVFDTIRFNQKTEEMRADIIACITALAELNFRMDTSATGTFISEEDQADISEGLAQILEEYYADPALAEKVTVYDSYDASEIPEALDLWFVRTAAFGLTDVRVLDESEDFSILFERQGYHYAYVQLNNLPLEFDVKSVSKNLVPFLGAGPSYLIGEIYPEEVEVSTVRTVELLLSGNLYMTLEDGEWKILMSEFYTKTPTKVQ